jgi:FKBP-type peptidyl-prolyl cis-trans isomerase
MHREQIDNQPSSSGGKELPAGTRLEEFVIESVLGSGGFGITYLARDTSLNRQVVIKENLPSQFAHRDTTSLTVHPGPGREDQENFRWSLENFSREGEMLASLRHPGIVPVLRRFDAFGTAYFVMPFVEGVPLDQLIEERLKENKPFSEQELRGLLEHVLAALDHLHQRGIYHRDIKPGNLLITNDGIPVLIDFGSARQRLGERSMTVIESPGYTPFEQLQSRGNVGPWSDLYALGGTLEKAIVGQAPPKAMDRMRRDPRLPLAERGDLHETYTPAFLGTIDKALEVEESERWQNAGEWLAGLRREAARGLPRAAAPGHAPPLVSAASSHPAEAQERKNKALLWAVAACMVLGLIAVAKSISGDKAEASASQVRERAAQAEQENQKLIAEKKAKEDAHYKEVERQRAERAEQEHQAKIAEENARQEAEAKAAMEKQVKQQAERQLQKVNVTSEPAGADVWKDGRMVGITPYVWLGGVPGTSTSYVVKLGGYEDGVSTGKVEIGKPLELKVILKPLPKPPLAGNQESEDRKYGIAQRVKSDWSYALGFRTGTGFVEQFGKFGVGAGDLDSENFLKGFMAAIKGSKPELEEVKLQAAMETLGEMLQAREKLTAQETPNEVPRRVKSDSSYALGFRTGGGFAQQFGKFGVGAGDLDPETFLKGFMAAIKGGKPELEEAKLQAAMETLGEMLQRREKEKAAANLKAGKKFLAENAKREGVITTKSGLQYEVITKGGSEKYAAPKEGDKDAAEKQFLVHYKGTLIDGKEFDASPAGEPVPMTLEVVPGFKEALTTMPVGAKWKIFIPSDLAYGEERRSAEIGPNCVLTFELELVRIQVVPQ